MTRLKITIVSLVFVSLAMGCRRDSDLPARYQGKVASGLMPIRLRERASDRSIVAAAARPEDLAPAAAQPGTPAEGAIPIDDSSAEAIVNTYVQIAAAGAVGQLPDVVIPEQQETARAIAGMVAPLMGATAHLERAAQARFGHAMQLPSTGGPEGSFDFAKRFSIVEVTLDPADETRGQAEIKDEKSGDTTTLTLMQIDGRWRVQDPEIPPADEFEQARPMFEMLGQMGQILEAVAARIESGEIVDEQAAQQELQQAMAKAMGPMMEAMMRGMGEAMANATSEEVAEVDPSEQQGEVTLTLKNEVASELQVIITNTETKQKTELRLKPREAVPVDVAKGLYGCFFAALRPNGDFEAFIITPEQMLDRPETWTFSMQAGNVAEGGGLKRVVQSIPPQGLGEHTGEEDRQGAPADPDAESLADEEPFDAGEVYTLSRVGTEEIAQRGRTVTISLEYDLNADKQSQDFYVVVKVRPRDPARDKVGTFEKVERHPTTDSDRTSGRVTFTLENVAGVVGQGIAYVHLGKLTQEPEPGEIDLGTFEPLSNRLSVPVRFR